MAHWSEDDIPDQTGRTALVTGATGGLGLRTAIVLAHKGARVLLAARDKQRGADALEIVKSQATDATPEVIDMDLADLASVKAAVPEIRERTGDKLDLLINNAGIMAPPLGFSVDGYENQWATNVFGPAALTWSLLPAISHVPGARVVFVSSVAHFGGLMKPEQLDGFSHGDKYSAWGFYGNTKLADLLLSRELQKYFLRSKAEAVSVAAHPGVAATNLVSSTTAGKPAWVKGAASSVISVLGQPAQGGALPILYAATEPVVQGSQYFGPAWVFETRGPPARAARSPQSRSDELGAALVEFVEQMTLVPAPR
jgi:protochlorophyllide reductase